MTRRNLLSLLGLGAGAAAVGSGALAGGSDGRGSEVTTVSAGSGSFPFELADAEWRRRLTPAAYQVLRGHGTERPFTSPLNNEKRKGVFHCAGCDHALFDSATKFDSGTGWPSFWQPLPGGVGTSVDKSFFMTRVEVHCANCGGHLGHVFEDGPAPTGLRYCMNGVAMGFKPASA